MSILVYLKEIKEAIPRELQIEKTIAS